jgi:CheY-like chemotaxis protein
VSALPTILLVEDDRDDLEVAVRAIRRAGLAVDVAVARDGQEAVERLRLDAAAPDRAPAALPLVVFLDLQMPRMDGWELLRRLRRAPHTAGLPAVVVSWSDRPEDVQRSYELGANGYLVKRYDPRSPGAYLAEAVRDWLQPDPSSSAKARPADPRRRPPL